MNHFETLLTLEKLQSHSEAEEGVSMGNIQGPQESDPCRQQPTPRPVPRLKGDTWTQISVPGQRTPRLLKDTATTKEVLIPVDRRGPPSRDCSTGIVTTKEEKP